MAVQANIQALNNTETGVIQLTTTLTEKAAFKIAETVGDTAGAIGSAIPIFNLISTLIRGIVDTVNAKYETSLNVFNNYEPYELPFKSEVVEAAAEDVQKWFGAEKVRKAAAGGRQYSFNSNLQTSNKSDSKLFDFMQKVFTPKVVVIAGSLVVIAGIVWYFMNKKKS